jgi:hypothetical protein
LHELLIQAVFSQAIDITARKEHEAQFENDVNDALWLGRIRDAIDDDRLVLYSQPIVDLLTGETVQHELLIRAHQPGARLSANHTHARHLTQRPNPAAAREAERAVAGAPPKVL